MANKTSPHILNTSANLLGFCLFVITSLQISDKMEADYIDEFTCIIAIILTFSCSYNTNHLQFSVIIEQNSSKQKSEIQNLGLKKIKIIQKLIQYIQLKAYLKLLNILLILFHSKITCLLL